MATMTLGGPWNGAGGHASSGAPCTLLLVVERELRARTAIRRGRERSVPRWLGVVATFVAWSVLLVVFRSPSLAHALAMLGRMAIPERGSNSIHERFAVAVVDASTWIDDDGFRDGHHLDRRGADLFTERMASEVIAQPLAVARRPHRRGALARRTAVCRTAVLDRAGGRR